MSWSHLLQTTRALCQLLRCFHGKLSTSAPWLLASVSAAWLKRVHLLDPGRFLGRLNTWLRERPVHPGHVAAGTRAWWLLREAAAILLSDERKVRNGRGLPRLPSGGGPRTIPPSQLLPSPSRTRKPETPEMPLHSGGMFKLPDSSCRNGVLSNGQIAASKYPDQTRVCTDRTRRSLHPAEGPAWPRSFPHLLIQTLWYLRLM